MPKKVTISRYSTPNTPQYTAIAIRALKDFGITITADIKKRIKTAPTEEAVDRIKRELIDAQLKLYA